MPIQRACQWATVAACAAVLSGCAWHHHEQGGQRAISNQCRTQASCNYNGHYEPGERDYAEQEAKRLNQQQTQRLQSRSSWW